jgi:hypothetical protein
MFVAQALSFVKNLLRGAVRMVLTAMVIGGHDGPFALLVKPVIQALHAPQLDVQLIGDLPGIAAALPLLKKSPSALGSEWRLALRPP